MKWVKLTQTFCVIVLFIVAMYFAYQSFESSFNPRRGWEKRNSNGPPAMSPAMTAAMQNQKRREDSGKKTNAESPNNKSAKDTASNKEHASEQTRKNGGE